MFEIDLAKWHWPCRIFLTLCINKFHDDVPEEKISEELSLCPRI